MIMKANKRSDNANNIQNLLNKGLTQSQVARVLQVSRQNIHQIIKHYDLTEPRLDTEESLCYHRDVNELKELRSERTPKTLS